MTAVNCAVVSRAVNEEVPFTATLATVGVGVGVVVTGGEGDVGVVLSEHQAAARARHMPTIASRRSVGVPVLEL